MKRLPTLLLASVFALGMLAVTGCDSGSPNAGDGTLDVQFTDSQSGTTAALTSAKAASDPDSIKEALVTISEVSVVPAEDTSDESAGGVSVLSEDSFEIDLKDLQAGVDTALSSMTIPSGTSYSQLRLVTAGKAQVTFADDSTEAVRIASGQQTGLKLNFAPFTLESEDDRAKVTVDFNVQETLKGSSQGEWVITPVVDATVEVTSAGN